jgi:poly-gamma-glutamate synthesis protein (capsule biosynthesis protein)
MSFGSLGRGASLASILVLAGCGRDDVRLAPTPPAAVFAPSVTMPAAPTRPTSIRVIVGGDLLPHRPSLYAPERVSQALARLAPLLETADVSVANYETATGDPLIFGSNSISLAVPSAWMGAVAGAHFHALTVANNHACDLGKSGLEATLKAAKSLDVEVLGADAKDPWRPQVLVEKDGRRVCAVAWTTMVNGGGSCKRSGELAIAGFDRNGTTQIEHAMARAREGGCDAIVAILHGGKEYAPQIWGPRQQARRAAEAGADAVVIHHPHVPSPVDVVTTTDGRRVPVFDSVGNLVSNQGESWKQPLPPESRQRLISLNAWTRLGVLADLEWTWSAGAPAGTRAEGRGFSWGYHLVWTENEHADNRNEALPRIEARPVDPTADKALLDRLATDEQGPKRLLVDDCWLESSKKRCDAAPAARKNEPIF